ncbi:MAG: High-affinity nickel-transporter, partial [Kibdelosporangium sp.]
MIRRTLVLAALCGLALLLPVGAASAHPLGNFSVNHHHGLHLYPDRVEVRSIVDLAEIPTLQEKSVAADRQCGELAGSLRSAVDERQLTWTVRSATVQRPKGQADLPTTRLTCELTAPADISGPVTLSFADSYRTD